MCCNFQKLGWVKFFIFWNNPNELQVTVTLELSSSREGDFISLRELQLLLDIRQRTKSIGHGTKTTGHGTCGSGLCQSYI